MFTFYRSQRSHEHDAPAEETNTDTSAPVFDDSTISADLATQLDVKEFLETREQNAREERAFEKTARLIDRASHVKVKGYDFEMRCLEKGLYDLHAVTPSLDSITLLREGSAVMSMSKVVNRRPRTLEPIDWYYRHSLRRNQLRHSGEGTRAPKRSVTVTPRLREKSFKDKLSDVPDGHNDSDNTKKTPKREPESGAARRDSTSSALSTEHDDLHYYRKDAIESATLLNNDTKNNIKRALFVSNNLHKLYKKRFYKVVRRPRAKQESAHWYIRQVVKSGQTVSHEHGDNDENIPKEIEPNLISPSVDTTQDLNCDDKPDRNQAESEIEETNGDQQTEVATQIVSKAEVINGRRRRSSLAAIAEKDETD